MIRGRQTASPQSLQDLMSNVGEGADGGVPQPARGGSTWGFDEEGGGESMFDEEEEGGGGAFGMKPPPIPKR